MVAANVATFDTWVTEGIAAFFEKFIGHIDANGRLHISFGYFSNWRFPITQAIIGRASLKDLFQTSDQNLARSLMLFLHDKGDLQDFVREVHRGGKSSQPVKILERICGLTLPAIEREWMVWVSRQPIDETVNLVPEAMVLPQDEWSVWWQKNKDRLTWDEIHLRYRVRTNSDPQKDTDRSNEKQP